MDLRPYVEGLREELAVVAEAGGGEARALADRLTAPMESAVRLMLFSALSAAAGEITRELAPGSVDVRLRGRDPEFVVMAPPTEVAFDGARSGATEVPVDEGNVSRINFRVSEGLKARIEEAAARDGLSVNAWLVRLTSAALDENRGGPRRRGGGLGGQSFSGWVR
jgi:hypothetical protein